jgi:hypothetical protein
MKEDPVPWICLGVEIEVGVFVFTLVCHMKRLRAAEGETLV